VPLQSFTKAYRTHSFTSSKAEHDDDVELQEKILDLPVALDEVIQLVRDLWERGLNDSVPLPVLVNQLKSLLAVDAEGEADRNEPEGFDCLQTLVNPEPDSEDVDSSVPVVSREGSSDTGTMDSSKYTVKSITSFKERTSWLYPPREMKR
jgi:hypothetical protein